MNNPANNTLKMASQVGIDNAYRHFDDMERSIGTETILSNTSNQSHRSDKENAERHDNAEQRTSTVRLESKDVKDQYNIVTQDDVTSKGTCDKDSRQERTSAVKLKLKGDDERFNVVTLSKDTKDDKADDESSMMSEDFEDNDFDALVGEFFWYLRDKKSSKWTPRSSKTLSSTSIQDRTPRAMGGERVRTRRSGFEDKGAPERNNGFLQVRDTDLNLNIDPTPNEMPRATGDDRILTPKKDEMDASESTLYLFDSICRGSSPQGTPRWSGGNSFGNGILTSRNSDKNEGFLSSKTADRTNRSLQFSELEESVYQKENFTSIMFGGIEDEEESEAIPVPPVAFENHHDGSKVVAMCGDSLSKESLESKVSISTPIKPGCVDRVDNAKWEKMTPSRSEQDCKAYAVWTKKGLMKQTPTPVKRLQSHIDSYERNEVLLERSHRVSPPRASKSPRETRDEDEKAGLQKKTPAESHEYENTDLGTYMDEEDFRALKVWAKRGMTRGPGSAIKVASSRVEDNEDVSEAFGEQNGEDGILLPTRSPFSPVGRYSQSIVTWPPPVAKLHSDWCASPSNEENSDTMDVSAKAVEEYEEESTDEISLDFDADRELSRILDDSDSSQLLCHHANDEALDDDSNKDVELRKIIDESPGVNTVMSVTRNFIERRQHLLNSADSQQACEATPVAKSNLPYIKIYVGESESTEGNDTSVLETYKDAKEPDSSFVLASSKSIVAEGSSVKLSAPSLTSVHEREIPTEFIDCRIVPAEPDGYLMDDESSCLTTPSLSPASANTGGTKVRFEKQLPEYRTETQMAQQFPNIGTFSPLSANSEEVDDAFGGVSSEMNDLSGAAGPTPTNESSIVFDSLLREKPHMEQASVSDNTRSNDSTTSGKMCGTFVALSAIEKKPDPTLTVQTRIVFDSPAQTQNTLEGESTVKKPPSGRSDAPPESQGDGRLTEAPPDPILRYGSMSAKSFASSSSKSSDSNRPFVDDEAQTLRTLTPIKADPIILNRSSSMSESSFESRESASSTPTVSFKDTDNNHTRSSDTVDVAFHTQNTIVLDSFADSASRKSTFPTESSANVGDLAENSLHQSPKELVSLKQLPSIHSDSSESIPQPGTVKSSGNQTADDEESTRLPYAMPQSIQFDDAHSVQESFDGPSSLTYSLSFASKEPSLSTACTTSPLKALQLVKSEDTVAASPPVASEPDSIIEAPAPKVLTPRKRSSRFNSILGQWKEKSEHNHNGHFLSPPSNDTVPNQSQTPPLTTEMPFRRRSTGDYVPVEKKGETTLPAWTPQKQPQRRKSIDISSITIPNKAVFLSNKKAKDSTKTVGYWNGMIQNEGAPSDNTWVSRSGTRRESLEQANLMMNVPKEDPMTSLSMSFSRDTIGTSATYQDDDVPCKCTESAFSGNDELLEFFLPKLGMAHTCGKRNPPILIDSDPIGLHHILRPWQVEFLRSCDIYRGDQLVKACKNRAGSLAGAMRKWRLDHDMTCPRSAACGMALHIWSRTCKYYVRTIRRQMADGLVEVEPPCLRDVMTTVESKDTSFLSSEGGSSKVE